MLRAAEEYPQVRYGLTANVCWSRFWLLLPEGVQENVSAARERLNKVGQDIPPVEVTTFDVQSYRDHLIDQGRKPATVNSRDGAR